MTAARAQAPGVTGHGAMTRALTASESRGCPVAEAQGNMLSRAFAAGPQPGRERDHDPGRDCRQAALAPR